MEMQKQDVLRKEGGMGPMKGMAKQLRFKVHLYNPIYEIVPFLLPAVVSAAVSASLGQSFLIPILRLFPASA